MTCLPPLRTGRRLSVKNAESLTRSAASLCRAACAMGLTPTPSWTAWMAPSLKSPAHRAGEAPAGSCWKAKCSLTSALSQTSTPEDGDGISAASPTSSIISAVLPLCKGTILQASPTTILPASSLHFGYNVRLDNQFLNDCTSID